MSNVKSTLERREIKGKGFSLYKFKVRSLSLSTCYLLLSELYIMDICSYIGAKVISDRL